MRQVGLRYRPKPCTLYSLLIFPCPNSPGPTVPLTAERSIPPVTSSNSLPWHTAVRVVFLAPASDHFTPLLKTWQGFPIQLTVKAFWWSQGPAWSSHPLISLDSSQCSPYPGQAHSSPRPMF